MRFVTAIMTRLTVIIWISCAIIASIAGPFGTYASMDLPVRTAYWSVSIGVAIVLARGMRMGIEHVGAQISRTLQDVILALGFSALYTAIVHILNDLALDAVMRGRVTPLETFAFVLAVSVIVVMIRRALGLGVIRIGTGPDPGMSPVSAPVAAPVSTPVSGNPAKASRPRILDRIGASATAGVVRLTVDDHYVIVVLEDGSTHRLLLRFVDAIAEMDGTDGVCTHRSHWVTIRAIQSACRENGRDSLCLTNGERIPVSRTYRPGLERRGLLPPLTGRILAVTD